MLTRSLLFTFLLFVFIVHSKAQVTIFGKDNHANVTVTASSEDQSSLAKNVINGKGMDAEAMEAARFLAMGSFGFKMPEVELVQSIGFNEWINQEFNKPKFHYADQLESIWATVYQQRKDAGIPEDMIFGPLTEHFNYSWWQNIITKEDQLRHRMAFALSQILVISSKSDLRNYARAMAEYYDVLYDNAFGNYRDLLMEVTMHPAMGYFLSHLNNAKADGVNVIRPDENFAREIMQLFTIGLHQLNQNGTIKMTPDGRPLPSYDPDDIRELAKVFTGLGPGAVDGLYPFIPEPYFGLGFWGTDKAVSMAMYDDHHDQSEKELIEGLVLPAGQTGMKDIEDAVDHLFNHPNVGPFVCRQLIQRFVKSNPSPDYISRVASVFNNNGNGVRGDLKAVIKAILLDDEARTCEALQDPNHGKLREPTLRFAQLARSFNLVSPLNRYWDHGAGHLEWTGQMALSAPSVFNFYEPDYQPPGELTLNGLVGPEFKIFNSKTSIGYINIINGAVMWDTFIRSWEIDYGDEIVRMDLTDLEQYADDMERVINHFDILLTNGQLSDRMRKEMRTASDGLLWGDVDFTKVRMALYGLMISPDYTIFK